MPFDASGNFTRSYNFQQDRDNGIKILAARVDGEFDNFATGMNAVFFRDGRVPMQADLRLNINGITGLKDGALGSPAIKFQTDANTGAYLDGLNRYAIGVNSVQRAVFTTTGVDVIGNLTASGTFNSTGAISEAGTALTAKYALIASPTFTGVPAGPTAAGGTNTTQLATTAFVAGAVTGLASTASVAATYAPLASPALTGTPTAPTAAGTTNNTQIATTAFVAGAYLPLTGGTINGNLTVNAVLQTNNASIVNGATNAVRSRFWFGGGAYAADISLQADNAVLKHNCATAHQFAVGGTGIANFQSNGLLMLGTGTVQGSANATNYGFTHNKGGAAGQVGYHMYNGGAVVEWLMYQPAHATGDDFRIGTVIAGAVTDRMKMDAGGNVNFNGNITSASDARLKSNVQTLEGGLDLVRKLRGTRFIKDGRPDLGLIAQEVRDVVPEVVLGGGADYLSVDYGRLVSPLIEAVKELANRLERVERFLVL